MFRSGRDSWRKHELGSSRWRPSGSRPGPLAWCLVSAVAPPCPLAAWTQWDKANATSHARGQHSAHELVVKMIPGATDGRQLAAHERQWNLNTSGRGGGERVAANWLLERCAGLTVLAPVCSGRHSAQTARRHRHTRACRRLAIGRRKPASQQACGPRSFP